MATPRPHHRPSVRQLEYVVAVAEHRSFRRAATACRVTQPALSALVAGLERDLGTQIFERDRRRVLITAAGEELVVRARRVLAELDELVEVDLVEDRRVSPGQLGLNVHHLLLGELAHGPDAALALGRRDLLGLAKPDVGQAQCREQNGQDQAVNDDGLAHAGRF